MADVDFRVKFPYHVNTVATPVNVDTEEPTFTALNVLDITDNLPVGKYRLSVNYEWLMADINDSAIFRIISPITEGTEYRQEPNDLSDVEIRSVCQDLDWIGGPIQFSFEGSITVGGQALTVNTSQVIFERKV